ncbi:MAG TPA: DUF4183 domain-containing protein [Clostridiaceae bacterium]|nr:DUF4183 domain-containing protein [Clostridiaceae bacterium]
MAAALIKLVVTAETQTTVLTKPTVEKYFYKFDTQHLDDQTGTLTIPANAFVDDQGDSVDSITPISENNGYYLLFINGALQQDGLYTVDTDEEEVVIQDAGSIEVDSPIVLVVTNFQPEANSDTTVKT